MKGILWDNDGVLVDTEPLYLQASRETLLEIGIELTLAQYLEISLERGASVFELAEERGLQAEDVEDLRALRDDRYAELLRSGPEIREGAIECLSRLHGLVRMGIVTSAPREHFEIIHETSGLIDFFDFAIVREDYIRAKPDPEPYLSGLSLLNLPAGRCVAVEDTERGLRSAVRAGIRCVVIPNRLNRESTFAGAERVVTGMPELERQLRSLLSI